MRRRQLPQPRKVGPRSLGVLIPRRHRHQPGQPQLRAGANRLHQRRQLRRVAAVLGVLFRELHFNHHFHRLAALVEPPRQLGRIHRLHHIEQLGRFLRFVRLQMADQVKPRPGERRQQRPLAFKLLHVVLPKLAHPQRVGLFDHARRKHLGHRQQQHLALAPSRLGAGRGNPLLHLVPSFSQSIRHQNQKTACN